jgi:hypothetical protein
MNAPSVIPQLILNLCKISIATCNKIFNQMSPFNGDKIRPRLTARAGGKTFSWLFVTGSSVTCMTAQSFNAAFPIISLAEYKMNSTAPPPWTRK